MQEHTKYDAVHVSEKVRAARRAFAQAYPPGPEAELAAMGVVMIILARARSVSEAKREHLFEEAILSAAEKAVKDEPGVEQHLVGPLELDGEELRVFLSTAEHIGAIAGLELANRTRLDLRSTPADLGKVDSVTELLQDQEMASSIVTAIHTYASPQIIA